MKELLVLLSPFLWSVKNDIIRFRRSFYRKTFFYAVSSGAFLFLFTKLLGAGMTKLQGMSSDVFDSLLMKGYSLIFLIIFVIQVINGVILALSVFFQAKDLEVLFTSPVNRTFLFFSRLLEVHLKASWMLVIFGIPLLVASGLLYHASLLYHVLAVILVAVFSGIAVNAGVALAVFICIFFQARRVRKVLLSLGVIVAVLMVILLRIVKPEGYVNPELFANLTFFITELKAPSFVLLPNRWLSEAIFFLLGKFSGGEGVPFIGLIFLTCYVSTAFLLTVFKKYYYRGWGLLQEGEVVRLGGGARGGLPAPRRRGQMIGGAIQRLFFAFGGRCGTLMGKDFRCQMRDVRNVHQLFVLVSVIVVYLISIASLPLNWVGYEAQLKYVVSFLNLGLILVIVASLCSRLVYPAIVSEGTFLWILKTSPVTAKRYVWTKFLFFLIAILPAGQLLAISSSIIIGIERDFIILKAATTAVLTLSLLGLAVFFGTSDMKHEGSGAYQKEKVTESPAYLLISVFLILFTLALEIAPVFLYFLKESGQSVFTMKAWTLIGGTALLLFVVNLLITLFSLSLSWKKLEKLDG